jgi:hypothetical protein
MLRPRHRSDEEIEIPMTPMIDVTFLLLIFFMCTLQFRSLEGKLSAFLPKDVGVTNQNQEERPEEIEIVLEVIDPGTRLALDGSAIPAGPHSGRFSFGPDRRLAYHIGPRVGSDIGFVSRRLTELLRADPDRDAVLAPLPGVVHAEVVELLDTLLDIGVTDVRIQGAADADRTR